MGGKGSSSAQRRAARAAERQAEFQRQALEEQRKMNNLQAARQRREAFREARAVQGSAIQAGAATGTMGSSGLMGGVSSIGAQLGSNVSFLDEMQARSDQASLFNIEAARQGSLAAKYQAQAASSRSSMGAIGALVGAGISFAVPGGGSIAAATLGANLGGTTGQLLG